MGDYEILKYLLGGGAGGGAVAASMWFWVKSQFESLSDQNKAQLRRLEAVEKINSDLLAETKVQTALLEAMVHRGVKMNGGDR